MAEKSHFSDYTQEHYTQKDFVHLIEHRVRKDLRLHQSLSVKENYTILSSNLLTTQVLQKLLEHIFEGRLTVDVVSEQTENTLSSDCLEPYVMKRLDVFTKGTALGALSNKQITPLRTVTLHECQELAKIFNLQGELPEKASDFVEQLQKQYPQTKPSLLKSFLALETKLSEKDSSK